MEVALSCSGLWKVYEMGDEKVQAIRGIDLEIYKGEMVAVMGPSGCGKTTLLNIISGIDEPSAGQVFVAQKPLFGIPDDDRTDIRAKEMGFIFQKFHLLDVMNTIENVEIPLLLSGLNPDEAIAIEDAKAGVTAARGAGLRCLASPSFYTIEHDLSKATTVVESLADRGDGKPVTIDYLGMLAD